MKIVKQLRLPFFAVFIASFFGCQSYVEDLNVNPNEFTDISTALILNHSVLNLVAIQEAEPARIAGMWTDQFTGSDRQYITQDNYGVNDADFNATWADLYRGGFSQAQIAAEKAQEEGSTILLGVAQILQGYYAAEAAMLFGDVPFSQAGDPAQFPDPVYDPQADVLNSALGLLEEGARNAGDLSVTAANSVLSSTATWAQFAQALEARYRLALRDYPGALAAAQAADFSSPAKSVDIIHTTTNFSENLFYQFEAEQRSDYLTFDESHLIRLITPDSEIYRGDAKTDDTNRFNYYSLPSADFRRLNVGVGGLFAADQDFPVIGYPEVQLIIAEAAARTGDEDLAIAALNNARNFWDGVLGTDDYIDYVAGDFASTDELLLTILTEKFVSVFGTPTFYDIIRTDNLIGTDLDGRDTPVQRFIYPATESSSNLNYPGLKTLDEPTPINS